MAHTHQSVIQNKDPHLSKSYVSSKGFKILSPKHQPSMFFLMLLFSLLCLLVFINLNAPPIYILDEARNAQCAKEMMQRHDLIVPTFNEQLRTDKPPLHYYFMIVAYKMFGISPFAARFFSGVMGILTIIITAIFVNRFIDRKTAFLTAVVLSCSTHFLFEFRLAVPDPYLIFFMVTGLLCGFTWLSENKPAYLYLAAVLFALGSLAKGPVAIILPSMCFLVFAIYKKNWKAIFTWRLFPATLLFLLIALPWYLMVHKASDGAWTNAFFLDHNINRFSTSREGHGGFFLLPLIVAFLGLLPFSSFSTVIVKRKKLVFSNDLSVFSLIVFSVITIFFSFSKTQLPNYALPAYPFIAIIIAYYLSKILNGTFKMPVYPFYIIAMIFCILPVAIYFILKSEVQTKPIAGIAGLLIFPLVLLLALLVKKNRLSNISLIYALTGVFFAFNLIVLSIIYPAAYTNNPATKTIEVVRSAKAIAAFGHYNPAFNFYLDKPIKKFGPGQIDSLKTLTAGTVILSCSTHLNELNSLHFKLLAREHDIFEGRETLVFLK